MVLLSTGKMVHCTYAASWPTDTKITPGRKRGPDSPEEGDGARGGSGGGKRAANQDARYPTAPGDCARSGSVTGLVDMDLFVAVVELVAAIPCSTEVERSLADGFAVMCKHSRQSRPNLASRRDIAAIRSDRHRIHQRALTDEPFRSKLLEEIVQYVTNALIAAEICSSAATSAFRTELTEWVRTKFLRLVCGSLPDNILSPLLTAAEISPGTGDAAAAAPLPALATGGAAASSLVTAQHQPERRVPARALDFEAHQHIPDRCGNCGGDCKSKHSRLICSCSAICCIQCYGLRAADVTDVSGYACDTCREEHKGSVVVYPRKDFYFCFACRGELQPPPLEIQSWCPACHCRLCQRCAALAHSERRPAKRSSEGAVADGSISQLCPTCAGLEAYEDGRASVCTMLLSRVLGSNFQTIRSADITLNQLKKGKASADELGDLLYDCYFNGYREAFAKFLPAFMELVAAQLRHNQLPSVDPFHLLYYMGHDRACSTYLLARVCRAQAEHALAKRPQLVSARATKPMPDQRPSILKVAIFGSDILQNSPTADLAYSVFAYWHECQEGKRFEFHLFADGPVDRTHPPAADIERLFDGRVVLFNEKMSAKEKCDTILEKQPHALVTLTGWTHGHIAEVIAAVGSGPSRVLVINWLGWAGLMYMREAVHYTVVGPLTLSQRQRLELENFRERVAVVSCCYQPPQGHPSHVNANLGLTREAFNLPASDESFIFVFTGMTNRITEATFMMWLGIVVRVDRSCLLMLTKPKGMRAKLRRWINIYNTTAEVKFDPSRVLWRPAQNKTHYLALLAAAGENGAALDSVEPVGTHTTAGDANANALACLSYKSDVGFQTRVAWELATELGLEGECVAGSRAEFEEHAVQFALNRPQQRAIRDYLRRICKQRVEEAKLPRELLLVIDHGYAMFQKAGGDFMKLADFDVKDLFGVDGPAPVRRFVDSPEYAVLAAEDAGPDAAKRKELLGSLAAKGMDQRMVPHALKIMEEHQKKGLSLHSVVGAGGSSLVISATAKRNINQWVPEGTKVALKLSREGVPVDNIKNHSLAREGMNIVLLENRLERAEFGDIIPAPRFVWSSKRCRGFFGHTAADRDGLSMIFACEELIGECFDDVLKPFAEKWRSDGVLDEAFQYTVLRPWFRFAFELTQTAALAVMDAKPANTGRRPTGDLALWDLGNSIVYQKPGQNPVNDLPIPLSRNATAAFTSDSQTAALTKAKTKRRKLRGGKDTSSGLIIVSCQQVSEFCRNLTEQGGGLGRLTGEGTFGYADQALWGRNLKGLIEPDAAYAYDIFAFGRSVLKRLSHDPRKQSIHLWEASACQAAKDGPAGIRRMLEGAVEPSCARITQRITVDRVSSLLAGLLNPDPMLRMGAKAAMLHAANTLPIFSPQHSLALEDGRGIAMAGGPVESLPVPFRDHPDLKGKTLPPVVLLPQADMGVGVRLGRDLRKGEVAAVYGGEYIARADTGRLRRAYPSRYSVSSLKCDRFPNDGFIMDAAPTAKRPVVWLIDKNVAGPFMNGIGGVGFEVNCDLDRNSAWPDGSGGVWVLLTANRDIKAGEWLMWNYIWTAGAGIVIPGLTFAFD